MDLLYLEDRVVFCFSSCMASEEWMVLRSSLSSRLWQPHGGCEGAEESFLKIRAEWSLKANILQLHMIDLFCQFSDNSQTRKHTQSSPSPLSALQCMATLSQLSFISRGQRKWLLLSVVSLSLP